jgi:hypothetical protein
MASRNKAKKEQAALRRTALDNKAAAQHATALQDVSLSGEVLKDDDESMSTKLLEVAADALITDDDEKSSQSKKTSGKSGASKRKSSASASSSKACTPTKHRKMLSKHAKKPKARAETDARHAVNTVIVNSVTRMMSNKSQLQLLHLKRILHAFRHSCSQMCM